MTWSARRSCWLLLPALLASGLSLPARAADPGPAVFALVVGVNRSVDTQLAPLAYADDDAFRYRDLFRSVGARTWLLTRPDENTRRINAGLEEAQEPVDRVLGETVAVLAAEVAAARAAGRATVLYFVFAGHGNLGKSGAYLTLEDQRLTGADLDRRVLRAIGASESHLIVDACYSYFLAHERGPGGRARTVQGFSRLDGYLDRQDVGLLLSTSSARESHEWQEFQAGVFSHEVRSGLYGAADANQDGEVSYREIAAFVGWANAAIPNERFRPEVFARPPRGQGRLLDLRGALANRILVGPPLEPGHHLVEDQQGNRVAEFHNARGQSVRLVRPAAPLLYVRHLGTGREHEVPVGTGELRLADQPGRAAPLRARGAAHHAFSRIFSLPFDDWVVDQYESGSGEVIARAEADPRAGSGPPAWFGRAAAGAFALAAVSAGTAGWLGWSTRGLEEEARRSSQRRAGALNGTIRTRRGWAVGLGFAAGTAALTGAVLWLWPAPVQPTLTAEPGRPVLLGAGGSF